MSKSPLNSTRDPLLGEPSELLGNVHQVPKLNSYSPSPFLQLAIEVVRVQPTDVLEIGPSDKLEPRVLQCCLDSF